jgi:hypothetical protein
MPQLAILQPQTCQNGTKSVHLQLQHKDFNEAVLHSNEKHYLENDTVYRFYRAFNRFQRPHLGSYARPLQTRAPTWNNNHPIVIPEEPRDDFQDYNFGTYPLRSYP